MEDADLLTGSARSQGARVSANRLLVLDDDPAILALLAEVGRQWRYEVASIGSSAELHTIYDVFNPSLIVLDLRHGQGDAIEVMAFLKQRGCQVPIFLMTGLDTRILVAAQRIGEERGLTIAGAALKPVPLEVLGPFLEAHREPEIEEWADALEATIERDEIEVVYQPKIRLADGRPIGFEALARWTHPSRGAISPKHFIPLADSARLIERLTDRVIARSVAECAGWMAAGHDLTIAINLPAPILTRDRLREHLVAALATHELPATRVTLEVTESATLQKPLSSLEVLSRLRLRGFNLSLDDFGTGYASFSLLHRTPFNELKIDRSFIAEIEDSRASQVIVETLATLGRHLGMTTVAEGVEYLELCDWLRSAGVEQAQGFGIARPMPSAEVPAWLASWRPTFSA